MGAGLTVVFSNLKHRMVVATLSAETVITLVLALGSRVHVGIRLQMIRQGFQFGVLRHSSPARNQLQLQHSLHAD